MADIGKKYGTTYVDRCPNLTGRRLNLKTTMAAIREYEMTLFKRMVASMKQTPGVKIWGIADPVRLDRRAPTLAFTMSSFSPRQIAKYLGENGIYVWHGDFFAQALVEEFKKAEAEDKPVLRGTRYLLLKNQENLSPEQLCRLEELRSLNQNLNMVYVLKDDLKRLWDCMERDEAALLIAQWTQAAEESGIQPLMKFAKTLHHYASGLLNHCDYPINNGRFEGLNNKIKVIKRRCYRVASRRMASMIWIISR